MSMFVRLCLAVLSLLIVFPACSRSSNTASSTRQLGSSSPASPASSLVHVRGTVSAASSSELTVTTDRGSVQIMVLPSTKVAGVVPAAASDIKPNAFIGSANVPAAGTSSRALEVVVFPNSMRGTGEGNYSWDLQSNGRSSAMTNGTVSRGSMMTNGTVAQASTSGKPTLTVNYKGGSKQITVPPNTPIVRIVPGDQSLLKPGAHVFVLAKSANAHLVAARVIVGERGAVPPM